MFTFLRRKTGPPLKSLKDFKTDFWILESLFLVFYFEKEHIPLTRSKNQKYFRMIMLEEIDFNNSDCAYDRVLELANCVDEKPTLVGKLNSLSSLAVSFFRLI